MLRDSDPVEVTSTPMWESDTFIRRIEAGKLESVVASYGYKQSNSLVFADPTTFDDFEAEVTVTEIHSKSSNTRARLGGYYFSSGGRDIFAEVGLRYTGNRIEGLLRSIQAAGIPTATTGRRSSLHKARTVSISIKAIRCV